MVASVTWETEVTKPMVGSDWQKSEASTLRCVEAAIQLAEGNIKRGLDPMQELAWIRGWLARCLYSLQHE